MIPFFDLAAAHARYAGDIDARLQRLFAHGNFIMGPEVAELEAELARRVGVAHAITVKSGTMALELALRALGVGPGDEVITTPFSWISAAEAIALLGARPVFVDIEPSGFLLDPNRLEAAITTRTKGIIPVSLFGQMPELEAIDELATRRGLFVIEDAAQSFGATRHGKASGSATTLAITSFFPTKPLGAYGDGGAVFTSDAELGRKLRVLRSHGAARRGEHTEVGVNGRLDTLQAGILLAKLPHFSADLATRQALAARYTAALAHRLDTPTLLPGNTHVYAQYTLRLPDRDAVRARLAARGIETAVYYPRPLHQQPVFAGHTADGALPEAERAGREALSLPIYPGLGEDAQARVIAALLED